MFPNIQSLTGQLLLPSLTTMLDGSSSSSHEVTNAKSATIAMERRANRSVLMRSCVINPILFEEHNEIKMPIYTSISKNFCAKKVPKSGGWGSGSIGTILTSEEIHEIFA